MKLDLRTVILAAEKGGDEIKKHFWKALQIEEKSTASDFRTKADLDSEKTILNILTKEFPHFNFYSEEQGLIDNKSEYTFIIDPLDGSNNFVIGVPNFSVSIGLVRDDICILGVVHHPILKQTYYAEKGSGAFLDKTKLSVNVETNIKKASVSYTCGYINSSDYSEKIDHKLHKLGIKRLLTNWSPAIEFCLLASGKIEAIINNANDIYDYTAGKLIAREAGAVITGFDGTKQHDDKSNIFLVSNGTKLHQDILGIL